MSRCICFALIGLVGVTGPAFAQSALPEGFTIEGHVALSNQWAYGDTYLYGTVDTNVGWSNGQFSVDASLLGSADDGSARKAVYASVGYLFGDGQKISIGAPRPGYDSYANFGYGGLSEGLEVSGFSRNGKSLLDAYQFDHNADVPFMVLGLRYDGNFAATKVAASLHGSPDGSGSLFSASAEYTGSFGKLSGGVELLNIPDVKSSQVKLHWEQSFANWDLGVSANDLKLEYTGLNLVDLLATELSAKYHVNDAISVSGFFANYHSSGAIASGPDTQAYGLGGQYSFGSGASVKASWIQDDGNDAYEISVRYDF